MRCSARARAALRAKQTRLAEARLRLVERMHHPKTSCRACPGRARGRRAPRKRRDGADRGSRARRVPEAPKRGLGERCTPRAYSETSRVDSAPPALPVPGGVCVARGGVLSGSRAPTCVSFGARDGVFSVWAVGGKPGERRFGVKTSSAHGARDRIRRPHPPGGYDRRRFVRNYVFVIIPRAGGGVCALAGGAAACVCSAAIVGGRGRPQVQAALRDARRTSSARYSEQVSVCVVVFFVILARAVISDFCDVFKQDVLFRRFVSFATKKSLAVPFFVVSRFS